MKNIEAYQNKTVGIDVPLPPGYLYTRGNYITETPGQKGAVMTNINATLEALRTQRQLDQDGVEVGVSRQALDEAIEFITSITGSKFPPLPVIRDPVEQKAARLLNLLGISYIHESQDITATRNLDFRCGDVFVEVKQFHAPRIAEQMSRVDNVIVFQGTKSVDLLIDAVLAKTTRA